jgi:hypothetical protein
MKRKRIIRIDRRLCFNLHSAEAAPRRDMVYKDDEIKKEIAEQHKRLKSLST